MVGNEGDKEEENKEEGEEEEGEGETLSWRTSHIPQFQSQPAFRQNSEASKASPANLCWLATFPIAPAQDGE